MDGRSLLRSLSVWSLGLLGAVVWLSLLLVTNFSGAVVALGLLVGIALLN